MLIFFLVVGILIIFFSLLSVRLIFLKKGEFKGTCASQSPFLNKEGEACGYCGKVISSTNPCSNSEVEKVLEKFK